MAKEKKFDADGKHYTFIPGENGSLTATAPKRPSLMDTLMAPRNPVKTIMPNPIPKMADGGMVEDEDRQTNDYLKNQFQSPQPPTPANPQLAPTDRGSAEEDDSTTSNDSRIQDSHPGHNEQDMLSAETAGKIKQAGQYGPDQEKAVLDSIMKNQGSIGNRAARGFAGLGDAIMGVAGKSGPGFLNSLENREQNKNKLAAESIPLLQGMNEKQMAQQQALEGQTNTTPLGKAKADFLAPLLQKFFPGKTPADYQRMLQNPDSVASMIGIPADVYKGEVEAKLKTNELKIQGINATTAQQQANTAEKRAEDESKNQDLQRQEEEQRLKGEALGSLGKMGPIDRLLHPDVSSGLSEQAGLGKKYSPDVLSYAQKHGITPAQANQIKMKRTGDQ